MLFQQSVSSNSQFELDGNGEHSDRGALWKPSRKWPPHNRAKDQVSSIARSRAWNCGLNVARGLIQDVESLNNKYKQKKPYGQAKSLGRRFRAWAFTSPTTVSFPESFPRLLWRLRKRYSLWVPSSAPGWTLRIYWLEARLQARTWHWPAPIFLYGIQQ